MSDAGSGTVALLKLKQIEGSFLTKPSDRPELKPIPLIKRERKDIREVSLRGKVCSSPERPVLPRAIFAKYGSVIVLLAMLVAMRSLEACEAGEGLSQATESNPFRFRIGAPSSAATWARPWFAAERRRDGWPSWHPCANPGKCQSGLDMGEMLARQASPRYSRLSNLLAASKCRLPFPPSLSQDVVGFRLDARRVLGSRQTLQVPVTTSRRKTASVCLDYLELLVFNRVLSPQSPLLITGFDTRIHGFGSIRIMTKTLDGSL